MRWAWSELANLATARLSRHTWQTEYRRRLSITDSLVVFGSVVAARFARFGGVSDTHQPAWVQTIGGYTLVALLLGLAWVCALFWGDAWSTRLIGHGWAEYEQLALVTFRLFGCIAIASLLLRIEFARGFLGVALPVGLVGLLVNRWVWRKIAARERSVGRYLTNVLVVGDPRSAGDIMRSFARDGQAGYRVVGVYFPGGALDPAELADLEVPVLQGPQSIRAAIAETGADTVAVAAIERLGSHGIRELAWDLVPLGVDLIVAPGIVDVADQRMQLRPVGNLPLVHVSQPNYNRATTFGKMAFDWVFAAGSLLVTGPVMLFAAIAIKLDSRGPVFYRSERIGLHGNPFQMIKFRTMVVDADKAKAELAEGDEGAGLLFKIRADPRVTRVGRFLRKYSLDELPQFFNVLLGDMSVVGPRPPLAEEVERYDITLQRKLLVRPGVTGLWQVSGRSDLPWAEAVRLDMYYIENWSMISDLLIIMKTVSAVTAADGAY
ncbi:sugar transferase [Nocardia sp.]|uniref:sugar transferase n=1 Tax=Nocardia sp. TaxID=1821 RepID=UPI003F9122A8